MIIDKQRHSLFKYILAFVLGGLLVLTGCDSTDATEPEDEIADVAITPENATLAVGEEVDFSVAALTAAGDTVRNVDLVLNWESTDPTVFTVANEGVAVGQDPGTAYCTVEVNTDEASKASRIQRFVGRDSAFVMVF